MREQMEQHRNNPACASCHKTMDPFGFALENFDVVGAWRRTNETGVALDTADVLPDGVKVDGVVGLRNALMERPDVFVRTLTEKLLVYARRPRPHVSGHAGGAKNRAGRPGPGLPVFGPRFGYR